MRGKERKKNNGVAKKIATFPSFFFFFELHLHPCNFEIKGRCNPLLYDFVASSLPNHLSLSHEARKRRKSGVLSLFSSFVASMETSRVVFASPPSVHFPPRRTPFLFFLEKKHGMSHINEVLSQY